MHVSGADFREKLQTHSDDALEPFPPVSFNALASQKNKLLYALGCSGGGGLFPRMR